MLAADAFPPGSLGVDRFDAMVARANASNILTLDVSTTPPDPSVPATVVATLGPQRASRFEIGNEVYDPRQGPPPNGYATAQDYLSQTSALVKAVRAAGARAGVTVAPCPIFYPEGSACWGGVDGRYHQWHRNISAACDGDSCPFDAVRPQPCPNCSHVTLSRCAFPLGFVRGISDVFCAVHHQVIAHNYVTEPNILKPFRTPSELLSAFLTLPQATMDFVKQ